MPIGSFSGLLGGGAVAGNFFVGTTAEDGNAIVVPGFIPNSMGAILNKGDVLCINYLVTPGDLSSVRSDYFAVSSVTDTIALAIITGYGGGWSPNEAGFDRTYLVGNVGAGGNNDEGFSVYAYNNGIDTMAEIVTAGYFDDVADVLEVGDVIVTSASDGADLIKVTAVTDTAVTVALTGFDQYVAP